jgi:hypothetical protein
MNGQRDAKNRATYYYVRVRSARRIVPVVVLVALIGLATAASASASRGFKSPSGNIGCVISKSSARCDIRSHSWNAPRKPSSCNLDWGGAIGVSNGRGHFLCAGDTTLGAGSQLGYGKTIHMGHMLCESQEAGMRCVNVRKGHGFFLSKQEYEFF